MSEIKFKKEFVNLLNSLIQINPSIIIDADKDNSSIFVKRTDESQSFAYILSASDDNFTFDGDQLAFYNFPEFHQIMKVFNNPNIEQDDNKLILSENKSKIKYILSDPESIKKGPSKVAFENPIISFNISASQLKEIRKMIALLGSKYVLLTSDVGSEEIRFTCTTDNHSNSWENMYELSTNTAEEKFSIKLSSPILSKIPEHDYRIEIVKDGIIKFVYLSDEVNLEIFAAEEE